MGGLFSSEEKNIFQDNSRNIDRFENKTTPNELRSFHEYLYVPEQRSSISSRTVSGTNLQTQHSNISSGYNSEQKLLPSEVSVEINQLKTPNFKNLQNQLYNIVNNITSWNWNTISHGEYQLVQLEKWNCEYSNIYSKFMQNVEEDMHDRIIIQKIVRVENLYLMGRFLIKKLEFQYKHAQERLLFHGTKRNNIDSICKENFNWRLHGRTKFGKGISFATRSAYANHYCDRRGMKTMIVAKVLTRAICNGSEDMEIPPYYDERQLLRYDTTGKDKRDVLVKYCDDEFYPAYIIYYEGKMCYQKGFSR